jgi:hypothetical protein
VKTYLFSFILLFFFGRASSQIINREPLSSRQTLYDIDATLDTDTKTVSGKMQAYWVNSSADTVADIRMHLYMNAFKNNKTTMNKESGGFFMWGNYTPGSIDITKFTDRSGRDLLPHMNFISPDDNNKDDQTVISVLLPEPAKPGDTVFINIVFDTKLPSLRRRTGFNGDFYFVAQWFPKFGVYEPTGMRHAAKGEWNCHQFHANSEFYADHSLYTVKISLPQDFIVGSCGLRTAIDSVAVERKKTLTYRAEDIVDFAWTAWPEYTIHTDLWRNVKITLLISKDRSNQVRRQISAVRNALEYFSEKVGPYPWPYVTIVDPPPVGDPSAGMEYTTLFTSQSSYLMPGFFHMPEMVTIHEFGHAYFMGILASNEFEEPWLDEGVNTFWEERIMDHYYGENSGMMDHPFLKISDKSFSRLDYVQSEGRQVVTNRAFSWNYPHDTYSMMSYNKTATILYTMMGIIGEETTDEVFREYYRKWAFKHPYGSDFVNTVNQVVKKADGDKFGQDMNWFFDQTLYGTGLCDYKVSGITNRSIESVGDTVNEVDPSVKKPKAETGLFRSSVELERAGEIKLPVEVLIHFNNGEEVKETWDGIERFKDFVFTGTREIEWVKIDPDFKIRMDVNYNNNSMTLNPDPLPGNRMMNKLIAFMQFFLSFISL